MYKYFLLLLTTLLAACSQTTEFQRPLPPVPNAWPVSAARVETEVASKTHWRAFFTDPRLQALIELALEQNRDLRIAVARVAEARAQYGVAKADRLLGVRLGSDTSVSMASVSYEIDFWGRVSGLSESARISYLATEEARRAVYISLIADVAGAYFTLLQLDELIATTKATVELREQSLSVIEKGMEAGGAYNYEFQQASGILESTRATLAASEYQRDAAQNKLNFLVGQIPESLPAGRTLDEQGVDAELAPGLPSEVLLMRPDVIAAEQRLKSAHANIGVARTAFFPKILLTAGFGVASQGLTTLASQGAWYFAPTISSFPLFDGGRTAAGVDIAEARKVIAVADYEKTIQQAFREVADLLSARASLSSQLRAAVANNSAQEKRLQIAQARYNAGLISYLEVLDGQRELVAAQQTSSQVRRAQLESSAQLYKALGGGAQKYE